MKKIAILSAGLFAAVLIGCNKNDSVNSTPKFGASTEVTIALVNQSLPSRAPGGKEDGVGDENKVSSLEFYIFDEAGTTLDPAVSDATPGYIKIEGDGTDAPGLTQKIKVSAGNNKKVIVVANMGLGAPTTDFDTYDEIRAYLSTGQFLATDGGTDHNSRLIPADGLEMSGYTTSATIIEGKGDNKVYITIGRLVSKINTPTIAADVPVTLIQEQIDEVWGAGSGIIPATPLTFTFKGYAVINGLDKSTVSFSGNAAGNYLDPENTEWTEWDWTGRTYLHSSFDTDGEYTNNYSGQQGADWFLDGDDAENAHRVYVYENKPDTKTVNNIEGYDPETVYAYVIKGELTDGATPVERYWRVDLTRDDIYHIMRNCVYKVTINGISTPGYGTPEEAETNPPVLPEPGETAADFIVSIAQWDINSYETEM